MPIDTYLDDAAYDRLIAKLVAIEHDPWRKGEKADQIKEALGEIGGLWPTSILPDFPLTSNA